MDDSGLAVAIVPWLVFAWAGHRILPLPFAWQGTVLFAGLAAILVGSAVRRARR